MEASGPSILEYDEESALQGLLNAFGSVFSLREIASAYCKAGHNADLAGEILYGLQGSTSTSTTHAPNESSESSYTHASIVEAKSENSSESSYGNVSEKSCHENGNLKASKPKRRPVSVGTISSVLGKGYIRSTPLSNGSCVATKPVKLDSKELPSFELREEEAKLDFAKDNGVHKDMEDFLFKMLGDGFQLDRDVIREVLAYSGYDITKSMEKLLDLSAVTLDKRIDFPGECSEKFIGACPKSESHSYQGKLQCMNNDAGSVSNTKGIELPGQQKERNDLQKEILAALFNASERPEELPGRSLAVREVKRSGAVGHVVVEPPRVTTAEHKTDAMYSRKDNEDEADVDEDDSYQFLRRAVKEYRVTMKEYYKSAVDAYAEGDRARAGKLMEQGHFFNQKAREADDESARKIFETRNGETQDKMSLDLHDHGAKEAIRLLKCHLSSLSGIPSIKYLKVIMETNDGDTSKGVRKRLIMKLLNKESIKWLEEGNAGTILICLEEINPKRLSFARK